MAAAKPKVKTKVKPVRRAKQVAAAAPPPVTLPYPAVVRDITPVSAVLGAQFPPQAVASSPPDQRALYLFALALAVAGSLLLGIAGAAPRLAWYWPEIFVPVTRERDGLSFLGACLVLYGVLAWGIFAPGA